MHCPFPFRARWLAAAVGLTATAALAEPAAPPEAAPDPRDARAPVPAVVYTGALAQHRRFSDETLQSWREANERVTRIGGWRSYAREAQASAPPASQPAPARSPAPR
jgi:hypothetical protein